MKITIEIEDQASDSDAAATCAWLDMLLRGEGHTVSNITWTPKNTAEMERYEQSLRRFYTDEEWAIRHLED